MNTGSDPVIRRAQSADAAALARFAEHAFRAAFGADTTASDLALFLAENFGEEQQTAELTDRDLHTLLVVAGADVIGYSQLRHAAPVPGLALLGGSAEIKRFYVDRAWHGQGIASVLMRATLAVAFPRTQRVWLSVWQKNLRAIAFYEKCGFRIVGEQPYRVGTDVQNDHIMLLEHVSPDAP